MCQPSPVYAASPTMQLLEPWMQARLPKVVDPPARAHIIQLAAGIFERQSALIATIATASAFQATTDAGVETDHHDTPAATQKHHSRWDQRLYKREQARPGFELYDTTKTTGAGLSAYVRAVSES